MEIYDGISTLTPPMATATQARKFSKSGTSQSPSVDSSFRYTRREMYDPSLHELWDRCNAIVLAWIMNTISPSLISTVIYASDAHKVWEYLNERFDKVNASRACYLHKEIAAPTQGIASVFVYFSKLRELWDEYETVAPPPSCLKDSYENAKDQILMTRPLPNRNQAYAMIVNVESQRRNGSCGINASIGVDGNDVIALLSNRGNNNGNNSGGDNINYKARTNYSYGWSALQCDYYKLKGHTRYNCYKLHGYPADFKYRKKGGTPNNYANNVCGVGN
ncbi:PREDICTED: uncharacterized protein LOC109238481 [Nicotiana attenuata]|uniref:uncharacterized protein LOC109238481 n=1 Tax=Nicotiana attenuata TaxID=49451 RepID=UPI000904FAEA|nr:PREDICTED: uncharacterized protein LOC109238481 [Nicotiana attenuata]